MRTPRFALVLLPVAALAACDSAVGGSQASIPTINNFADYQSFGNALTDGAATLGYTDPASLPTTDSAVYDGVMGVIADPNGANPTTVIGTLELNVLFGQNDIQGSVTNMIDENDVAYQGSLNINNGDIDRNADIATQFTYFADVGGTITDAGGESYSVDAILGGDLLGQGTYTEGLVDGFVTTSSGTTSLEGGYIGERRE